MNKTLIYIISFTFLLSCTESVNIRKCSKKNVSYEERQEIISNLEINPKKIELGDVQNTGEHIKKIVEFYNKGEKPIVIQKLDVSCGCMKTKLSKNIIAPKKSVKMEIDINPKNKMGYFSKAIFVRSTANKNPDLIRVKANFID